MKLITFLWLTLTLPAAFAVPVTPAERNFFCSRIEKLFAGTDAVFKEESCRSDDYMDAKQLAPNRIELTGLVGLSYYQGDDDYFSASLPCTLVYKKTSTGFRIVKKPVCGEVH